MPPKKGLFDRIKDTLQAKRNSIAYTLLLLALFFALAGWATLPEMVTLQLGQEANIAKNTALLIHLGIGAGFTGLFWWRPREIVYVVAAGLGVLLSAGVLALNSGMV